MQSSIKSQQFTDQIEDIGNTMDDKINCAVDNANQINIDETENIQVDIEHLYKVISKLNFKLNDQSKELQILKFRFETDEEKTERNDTSIVRRSHLKKYRNESTDLFSLTSLQENDGGDNFRESSENEMTESQSL